MKKSIYSYPSPSHDKILELIRAGHTDREVADAVAGVNYQYICRFRQYHGLPPGSVFKNKIKHEKQPIIDFCLSLSDVSEDRPFLDKQQVVIRHNKNKKYFAYIFEHEGKLCINLKCDPADTAALRRAYKSVKPALNANKNMQRRWNTLLVGGDISEAILHDMIRVSYNLTKPKVKMMSEKEYLKKVCGLDVKESLKSYEKRGGIKKEKVSRRARASYEKRINQLRQSGFPDIYAKLENE